MTIHLPSLGFTSDEIYLFSSITGGTSLHIIRSLTKDDWDNLSSKLPIEKVTKVHEETKRIQNEIELKEREDYFTKQHQFCFSHNKFHKVENILRCHTCNEAILPEVRKVENWDYYLHRNFD